MTRNGTVAAVILLVLVVAEINGITAKSLFEPHVNDADKYENIKKVRLTRAIRIVDKCLAACRGGVVAMYAFCRSVNNNTVRRFCWAVSLHAGKQSTAFDFEKHIDVDIESFGITYSTITTNGVSSCHFILIDGEFEGQQFSYLSHSSIECEEESGDIDTTLAEDIDQIVENFEEHNESNEGSQILIDKIKINKILVGEGVDDNINLIPKSLLLLNDMEFNTAKK
ncbi:unnamed protein product [Adineta steineri]|uniref:Uncharacterized protein n=1 Tax=Adineta steineri TaxID=433720 RepID=A0A816BIE6_9BILA|nr:unnamed protein product [Adineta steineri]CAF1609604.1 unnamed protein product [Adineta steineri]